MTHIDRLRYACLMDREEIYAAFLLSQNYLTRSKINARMPGAGAKFLELAISTLNDADWVPETMIVSGLHPDFHVRISCPKGEYEWTIEKLKKYENDLRRNLTDMIRRYERSGAGSNQATHDDSDSGIDESDEN